MRVPPPQLAPHAPGTGLRGLLRTIDGGPFQAYRRILGEHELGEFQVDVLSVPPDALGGPARVRLSIERTRAGLDGGFSRGEDAIVVLEDAIVRAAERAILELTGTAAGAAPGSGRLWIDTPGSDAVARSGARVEPARLSVTFSFELPAEGRRIRGQQAESIFFELLPRIGMASLLFPVRRINELKPKIQDLARRRAAAAALPDKGLAMLVPAPAFGGRAVPKDAMVSIDTLHGSVEGVAIPTGITLFVTAGVAGSGAWLRELACEREGLRPESAILSGPVAVLRPARHGFGPLDVRAFVQACPEVPNPAAYVVENAPAPLAVAASLVEAFEAGARIVVLDEDELPAGAFDRGGAAPWWSERTPALAPLIERLPELRDRWGVSFLIAARPGSGLIDVADNVVVLHSERVDDAGEAVRSARRAAARRSASGVRQAVAAPSPRSMRVEVEGDPAELKVAAWGGRGVRVGEDLIDLADTPLVRDPARLRAVAALLKLAARRAGSWRPVSEVLDELERASTRPALQVLEEPGLFDLAQPARLDIANALTRWKRVAFRVAAVTLRPNAEDLP